MEGRLMSLTKYLRDSRSDVARLVKETLPSSWAPTDWEGELLMEDPALLVKKGLDVAPRDFGVVGTAFECLARVLLAKKIASARQDCLNSFRAKWLLSQLADPEVASPFYQRQREVETTIESFWAGQADESGLVEGACFLARCEMAFRAGRLFMEGEDFLLFLKEKEAIVMEVAGFVPSFEVCFLDHVKDESAIRFDMDFGPASLLAGGADVDLYLDGTILDFKTVELGPKAALALEQCWAYYLLFLILKKEDPASSIAAFPVRRLMVYLARYGLFDDLEITAEVEKAGLKAAAKLEQLLKK
jgi:hypothetical protein